MFTSKYIKYMYTEIFKVLSNSPANKLIDPLFPLFW